MSLRVLAPADGTVVALSEVPDPVFAEAMCGPGIAIDPGQAELCEVRAPVSGTIMKMHPHAFVIVADDGGRGVLVHLGLDTVQLKGEGFTLHAEEKEHVEAGQLLVSWSPADIVAGGRSAVVPVVLMDTSADHLRLGVDPGATVSVGDELFTFN